MTTTKIEWADEVWNPLLGCTRVSPGCDRCYAITTATIRAGNPHPRVAAAFEGLTERRDGRLDWTGRVNLLPDRLTQPLAWRKPRRVFVNSQADLFHDDVPAEFIARVFAVMAATPQHAYQIPTKRHARMRALMGHPEFRALVADIVPMYSRNPDAAQDYVTTTWPLPNVWLGVSVENQKWADIRIPALLDTPAAVRWISAEPLLGPVDLTPWLKRPQRACGRCDPGGPMDNASAHLWGNCTCACHPPQPGIDWVVVGGESGPGARPMHPDWTRQLRDQCTAAGVSVFMKQWGHFGPVTCSPRPGDVWVTPDGATAAWKHSDGHIRQAGGDFRWPGTRTVLMRPWGKKGAGRELDGRTWDEYPPKYTGAVDA